jgi:hypothetical protein
MRKYANKAICLGIILSCLSLSFAACEPQEDAAEEAPAEAEASELSEAPEAPPPDFSVFLGDHFSEAEAEAMAAACAEESGLIVELRIGEAGDEARALLDGEDAPLVFAADGGEEAGLLLREGRLLDLSVVENEELRWRAEGVPEALRLAEDGAYGLPGGLQGRGIAFDEAVIAAFFGAGAAENFFEDCGRASWQEWAALVEAMELYLKAPSPARVSLGGRTYSFLPEKAAALEDLTGIFAFAGAGFKALGDHIMNAALSRAFVTAGALTAKTAALTPADSEELREAFSAYTGALDLFTSHLAGLYGAGVRGEDFIAAANYDRKQANRIFMEGKAVFMPCDSALLSELSALDAVKAARLRLLPVKLPDGEAEEGDDRAAFVNCSIPVKVSWYYCVNGVAAAADPELAAKAAQFLLWMEGWVAGRENAMSLSLWSYVKEGRLLGFLFDAAPENWRYAVFGEEGVRSWLRKELWAEEDREALADYLLRAWDGGAPELL